MRIAGEPDIYHLRSPEAAEFDLLTEIRNRHRQWFFDSNPVSLAASRVWLSTRTECDCLLAICVAPGDVIVGTIGWIDLSPEATEVGRLTVDYALAIDARVPAPAIRNLAFLASMTVGHFLFGTRRRGFVFIRTRGRNLSAHRVMRKCGLQRVTELDPSIGALQHPPDTEVWGIDRSTWQALHGIRVHSHARAAGNEQLP